LKNRSPSPLLVMTTTVTGLLLLAGLSPAGMADRVPRGALNTVGLTASSRSYSGVLITDFCAPYDGLECTQQNCKVRTGLRENTTGLWTIRHWSFGPTARLALGIRLSPSIP
jgi:hypothetical protein